MDEIVKAALKKWPNVPHCYGWLALDARGQWYMRDERIQAAGPFPRVKGSRIQHDKLLAFIERNYLHDDAGCWFFQNGPQRVYVQLEAAPYVWRIGASPPWPVTAHTGDEAHTESAWLDEHGRLFLHTELGFGIVHTLDMASAADAVEQGHWRPEAIAFGELPRRFGYQLAPAQGAASARV
ncbi:MAG: DUF2946 family protein [Burkholderiales bacterium]|nr:DUF2946 family protein [Burkholderiales bacterium]